MLPIVCLRNKLHYCHIFDAYQYLKQIQCLNCTLKHVQQYINTPLKNEKTFIFIFGKTHTLLIFMEEIHKLLANVVRQKKKKGFQCTVHLCLTVWQMRCHYPGLLRVPVALLSTLCPDKTHQLRKYPHACNSPWHSVSQAQNVLSLLTTAWQRGKGKPRLLNRLTSSQLNLA